MGGREGTGYGITVLQITPCAISPQWAALAPSRPSRIEKEDLRKPTSAFGDIISLGMCLRSRSLATPPGSEDPNLQNKRGSGAEQAAGKSPPSPPILVPPARSTR
ncbi:hypothetical protein AAFF_G00357300 [Aldrovandia affinis]|uniref:Uncharacterized protein n=1 Tax=Aldrovandia affinis TaxID=143900 RepID=A0AAD7X0X7_9TELE|nr:hypothetical protein AAFF_G00357300 [Aldrovandia affinis]